MEAGRQPLLALTGTASRLSTGPADLPTGLAYALAPGHPTPGWPSRLRPPFAILISTGFLTGFPSTTRFRLALGADSPCADYRGAGNLGFTAGEFLHSPDRYSCQHSHFRYLQPASQRTFSSLRNAPLPFPQRGIRSFGRWLSAPLHLPRGPTRPVSSYAFFQGWLLLSQPPGCLGLPTSFTTKPSVRDLSWRSGLLPFRRRTLAPAVCLPTVTCLSSEFASGW